MVQLGNLDSGAHSTIINCLQAGLKVCDKLMSEGLARLLVGALEKEIFMVELGEC